MSDDKRYSQAEHEALMAMWKEGYEKGLAAASKPHALRQIEESNSWTEDPTRLNALSAERTAERQKSHPTRLYAVGLPYEDQLESEHKLGRVLMLRGTFEAQVKRVDRGGGGSEWIYRIVTPQSMQDDPGWVSALFAQLARERGEGVLTEAVIERGWRRNGGDEAAVRAGMSRSGIDDAEKAVWHKAKPLQYRGGSQRAIRLVIGQTIPEATRRVLSCGGYFVELDAAAPVAPAYHLIWSDGGELLRGDLTASPPVPTYAAPAPVPVPVEKAPKPEGIGADAVIEPRRGRIDRGAGL